MGGERVSPGITHNGDHWKIPSIGGSSWLGMEIPAGVTDLYQEVGTDRSTFDVVWQCAWRKDGQIGRISMGVDVPIQERIQAALVAMRMQHGNDSETEGGSPP